MALIFRCLRGSGQVMFQNHAGTGLLFVTGMLAGTPPPVWLAGLLALLISTLLTPAEENGLGGYNAILVGAALATFLAPTPALALLVVLGALVTPTVMAAVSKITGGSALTAPFVVVTWLLLLATHQFPQFPASAAGAPTSWGLNFWLIAGLQGVSQVFLVQNPITGVLFLVGLALSSRWAAGLALLGSLLGAVVASAGGAPLAQVEAGLFGFSPVLTAIALGCTFFPPTPKNLSYAILATVFTAFAQAALNMALQPLSLPALTAPFVLVTWLFRAGRPEEISAS